MQAATINSAQVESLGSGKFSMDGHIYNLKTMFDQIQTDRINETEEQLADKLSAMAVMNHKMQQGRIALQQLRAAMNSLDDDDDKARVPYEAYREFAQNNIPGVPPLLYSMTIDRMESWRVHSPATFNKNSYNLLPKIDKAGFQTAIENMGSHLENLNQESQLDMLEISSHLKVRDNAIELLNQTTKEANTVLQSLIRNIN